MAAKRMTEFLKINGIIPGKRQMRKPLPSLKPTLKIMSDKSIKMNVNWDFMICMGICYIDSSFLKMVRCWKRLLIIE
jgi:hypothetical protein